MRDVAEIYTKKGTPVLVVFTRAFFIAYVGLLLVIMRSSYFPHSQISFSWIAYLVVLYLIAEYLYTLFGQRGIDLTFAWPLLGMVYAMNGVSILLNGQERFPLLNRAEHFASFVLISYVVWIFFTKYLPQDVWDDHPYYTSLLALAVTSMLGVGNELIELTIDSLFLTHYVGANFDTSIDLLMNSLGSGLFLAVRLILTSSDINS